VIQGGGFTTDFFKRVNIMDLFEADGKPKPTSKPQNTVQVSELDWVKAVSTVEEESDVMAMNEAQQEQATQFQEFNEEIQDEGKAEMEEPDSLKADSEGGTFESELTPIQRYALKYLEIVNPVADQKKDEEPLEFNENVWELEALQKIKEEEEQRMDEDDEVLFYEVVV